MEGKRLVLLILFPLFVAHGVHSQAPGSLSDEDLILTLNQKLALDKFKSRVMPFLPHPYMKEDIYLIRWLRAKNFNVDQAVQFLRDDLKWRKANGLEHSKIHNEDWSDMIEQFPVYVDTYDKNGAPVITAVAGHWNVRDAYLTGVANRLHRFLFKIMDEASMKVRDAMLQGKNVTRFHFLLNFDGFNVVQHACPMCLQGVVRFLTAYENHFPGMTDQIVLFNVPPGAMAFRPIVTGAISSRTRGHIKVFGTNKAEYTNYFLKFIDASQLTEDFGGTRKRIVD